MTKVVDLTYKYHLKCEKKMNLRGKWLKDMFRRFPEAKKISNKCISLNAISVTFKKCKLKQDATSFHLG